MGTIKQLRWWAYKILPLAYDDSLSYYEVLSKATQKLNEVIDTTNKLPEAISQEVASQLSGDDTDIYNNLFGGIINAIATKEADEITFTPNEKQGGEVIWLGDTLYEVVVPMAIGTNYVVGTNIVPVDVDGMLREIKAYICTHNEYFHERAKDAHNTQTYLYWKDKLYRVDADIHVDDILSERTTVDGKTTGQLTLVNTMDEITNHYIEMHEADNNLQTQIDGNDGDIENLQKEDVNLQKQITTNNETINSRVDNIVAQAGTDNTEVVDIRQGAEVTGNTIYTNAGNSVRQQITSVYNLIKGGNFYSYDNSANPFDSFNEQASSGYWGSKFMYPCGILKSITINVSESHTCHIICVNKDNKVIFQLNTSTNVGINNFEINQYFDEQYYILVSNIGLNYKQTANTRPSYNMTDNNDDLKGSIITPTEFGTYDFAVYANIIPAITDTKFIENTNNIKNLIDTNIGNTKNVIYGGNSLDEFVQSTDTSWWASDHTYSSGYVEKIVMKIAKNHNTKCYIAILDSVTNTFKYIGAQDETTSYVTFNVNGYFENPFYVYLQGEGIGFKTIGSGNFQSIHLNEVPMAGDKFTPVFENGPYVFGIEITYENTIINFLKYNKSRNKLFVCGDSITAGYPYIEGVQNYVQNDDIRWGATVGRTLGLETTFGAQSGNGWTYTTGSSYAKSITDETDFSLFDIAVYAWGTNDWYHNIPLGNIDDTEVGATIMGNINYCINKIYNDNPQIVLIISTPLQRTYTSADSFGYDSLNEAGYTLSQLCEKEIELCTKNGVPYIDNRLSPFNKHTIKGLMVDGLHPNKTGYKVLGSYLSAKIGSIILPYSEPLKGM